MFGEEQLRFLAYVQPELCCSRTEIRSPACTDTVFRLVPSKELTACALNAASVSRALSEAEFCLWAALVLSAREPPFAAAWLVFAAVEEAWVATFGDCVAKTAALALAAPGAEACGVCISVTDVEGKLVGAGDEGAA